MNLNTLVAVFWMPSPSDDHFGIGIPDLQQRSTFPLEGFRAGDIVADLDVDFFAAFLDNKVDLLLIQLSYIHIISPAQKFDADHVFINSPVIHISAAQDCIPDTGIAEIELFGTFQILLTPDIKTLDIIENKSITQILDVFAHSDMIGNSLTGS